jgi:hypothetical protein
MCRCHRVRHAPTLTPAASPPVSPQDVASAKSNLALTGAALTLQQGATFALQGQLNSSRAAEAVAANVTEAARAKVKATAGALADAVQKELEKKSLLYQIIEYGEKTKAAGDPLRRLPVVKVAIDEAQANADAASANVTSLSEAKRAADAELAKLAILQTLVAAKATGMQAIVAAAVNETASLQARLRGGAGFRGREGCGARGRGSGAAAPLAGRLLLS